MSQIALSLREAFALGLPRVAGAESHLRDALLQTLDHPGSLVRAQLVFEIGTHYGLDRKNAEDLAISIEYFHTASLLFDDLPCMDDAAKRRGVPCVHRTHGEATAILAALALINRAYALAWKAINSAPAEYRQTAADYLETCLGVAGVLSGQSQDLHYSTLPESARIPQNVALGKTVSLIRLSLVLPAVLGGATERERYHLERLATYWGLSYQIIDDLKDVLFQSELTDKTAGRDKLLDRPNDALKAGGRPAIQRLKRLLRLGDSSLSHLSGGQPTFSFLMHLRARFALELACFHLT